MQSQPPKQDVSSLLSSREAGSSISFWPNEESSSDFAKYGIALVPKGESYFPSHQEVSQSQSSSITLSFNEEKCHFEFHEKQGIKNAEEEEEEKHQNSKEEDADDGELEDEDEWKVENLEEDDV